MFTPKDAADTERIASWNERHGSILGRMRRVSVELADAVAAFEAVGLDQRGEALDRLHKAGAALADTARDGLRGPFAGVPEYDSPRREGLEMFVRAGTEASRYEPESGEHGFEAGVLLSRAAEVTAVAEEYAAGLLERLRNSRSS